MQFIFRNKVKILIGLILLEIFLNSIIIFFDSANKPFLYVIELISSVAIVVMATTFINKVNFYELLTNKSEAILNSSPAVFASYDVKNNSLKTSKLLPKVFNIDNSNSLTIKELRSLFDINVWNAIESFIEGAPAYEINGILKEDKVEGKYIEYDISFLFDVSKKISSVLFWFRDRSEVVKQEESLLKGYKKYQKLSYEYSVILQNLTCPVWMIDKNDEFCFTNNLFEKLAGNIGLTISEFQRSIKALYDNKFEESGHAKKILKKFLVNDSFRTYCFEQKLIHPMIGKVGFCYDVTELESNMESLKSVKAILDNTIESIGNPILILDKNLKVLEWNSAFTNFFDINNDVLLKAPSYSYIIDEFKSRSLFPELRDYREKHLVLVKEATSYQDTFIHLPDGRTLNLKIHPIKNGQTVLIFENITINLEMERALKDADKSIYAIFDSINFPAVLLNIFGKVEHANDALKAIMPDSENISLSNILKIVMKIKSAKKVEEVNSKIIDLLNAELINTFEEGHFVVKMRKLPNSKHLIIFEST